MAHYNPGRRNLAVAQTQEETEEEITVNVFTQTIIIKALQYALSQLQDFMSEQDFKEVLDLVLNKVESFFTEGSFQDTVAETIAGAVREFFHVEDSDPNN